MDISRVAKAGLRMKAKKCFLLAIGTVLAFGFFIFVTKHVGGESPIKVSPSISLRINNLVIHNFTRPDDDEILKNAKEIAVKNKAVLITMVNDVYLPFTYSWLCNTKNMNIHDSVLIITTDRHSKEELNKHWPKIRVASIDNTELSGHQDYSHVGYVNLMIRRTEIILSLLNADVEIFLFEVDCLWLTNVVPVLQSFKNVDLLVNPVAERTGVYAGGFLYMFPSNRTKALWKELTARLMKLEERIKTMSRDKYISEADNDQIYFSSLVVAKYSGIKVKELPLKDFEDGKWYKKPEETRKASRPLVINNNWVVGNVKKMERAKQWGHWFIKEDNTCDIETVGKVVYPNIQ